MTKQEYDIYYASLPEGTFTHLKANAKRRELDWQLSIEQFKYLVSEGCFVVGCSDKVSGLDRLDCAIGYIFSNVRPSCERHNEMRNDMSDEELYRKAKEIVEWYERSL